MLELLPEKTEKPELVPFEEMFEAYCKMDPISTEQNVNHIPLTQSDKWLMSARILDMVSLTYTDTGLAFFKFRKRAISFEEYMIYLKDLAKSRNLDLEAMKEKMQTCGKPVREGTMGKLGK